MVRRVKMPKVPKMQTTLSWPLLWLVSATAMAMPPLDAAAKPSIATDAGADLNRRLSLLAFADDGSSALIFERSGTVMVSEAVWIVDPTGVVEVLPLGTGAPMTVVPTLEQDICRRSAERLAAIARDYELISVRVGMCSHRSRPVVTSLKTRAPLTMSSDVGKLHQLVGFAGRTFMADRRPAGVGAAALVVVIGSDVFGNDRVGVTVHRH
jgi:hypothetical protein